MPRELGCVGGSPVRGAYEFEHRLLLAAVRHVVFPRSHQFLNQINGAVSRGVDFGYLIVAADRHRLLPLLGYLFVQRGLWTAASGGKKIAHRRLWKTAYESNVLRNKRLADEAAGIAQIWEDHGCWFRFRKGIVLAQQIYADPGQRPMSDIDVLISEDDIEKASEVLRDRGYVQGKVAPAEDDVILATRAEHFYWRRHSNTAVPFVRLADAPLVGSYNIDICRNLFLPDSGFSVPAGMVRDHLRGEGHVGGSRDLLVCVADLCAHIFKEATTLLYIRNGADLHLMKFLDVALALRRLGTDASNLVNLAREWRMETPMAFGLHLTHQAIPGAVPAELLQDLRITEEQLRSFGHADHVQGHWEEGLLHRLFDFERGERVPESRAPIET